MEVLYNRLRCKMSSMEKFDITRRVGKEDYSGKNDVR